jgi:hypothetical protein
MLWEDEIRYNKLAEIVYDIHNKDFVSDLRDADLDTVRLDDTEIP